MAGLRLEDTRKKYFPVGESISDRSVKSRANVICRKKMVGNSRKPIPSCFAKVNLREAAESADDSDDLSDFIADFGEQCGIGSTGRTRERSDETCVSAIIPTPVRVVS